MGQAREVAVDVCLTVVGGSVVLVTAPVVGVLVLVLWLWRCLALMAVMIFYKRKAQAASGMEALFALDSEAAKAVVSAVAILHGQISITEVLKLLSERVLELRDDSGNYSHPKFRQVVRKKFGVVVWMEEENFDASVHVRELREGGQPRTLEDEADLLGVIGGRTNLPFVRGYARWEVLVAYMSKFHGEELSGGHTAILVRLHHCMGDGRSLVGVLVTALAEPPLLQSQLHPVARHHQGGCLARALRVVWAVSNLPWVVCRVLRRNDNSPLHGCRLGGHKLLAWSVPLPLPALKVGRALAGVSVNDLLLAGMAQALHSYLVVEEGRAPERVMTVLPVDVTAPGTPPSLANRISLCTMSLPTGPMSPQRRLQEVHELLTGVKGSPDVLVNYLALGLISNLLPTPLARRALHTHGVTMVASSLPGPTETVHMFGEPVEELMFWIPNKSRTGVGVSILSYRGQLRLGINVDSTLVPTQEKAQHLMDQTAAATAQILLDTIKQKQEQQKEQQKEQQDEDQEIGIDVAPQVVTHSMDEYDESPQDQVVPFIRLQEDSLGSGSRKNEVVGGEDFGFYYSEDQLLLCRGALRELVGGDHKAHSDTNLQHGYMGHHKNSRFALSNIHLPHTHNHF